MKTLFIAFLVGICCFLSACDVRTSSDQKPIIINFDNVDIEQVEPSDEAIEKHNPAEVYKNLGASYLKQGKLDKAIVEFKKALHVDPRFVEGHYLLADVYSLKGEGILSRKSLDRAMALEGSYIIDIRSGIMDRIGTIIESTPPAVIRSEEVIELPPEFFEDPGKIGVPRKWESPPK